MSETKQHLLIKVGKRRWMITVMHSAEPPSNLYTYHTQSADKPDFYLVFEADADLRQRWIEAVTSQCGGEWETRLITLSLSDLDQSLLGPCLIIGPQRLLRHFCNAIASEGEDLTDASEGEDLTDGVAEKLIGLEGIDFLPDPSEVPRFFKEEHLDTFGQNPYFLNSAWSRIAKFVGSFAYEVHSRGIAVMLPISSPEQAELPMELQQAIVPLASSSDTYITLESVKQGNSALLDVKETDLGLDLVQRCLLILTALSSETEATHEWLGTAEFIEELGYILVSHSIDIQACPQDLIAHFLIGKAAALMHSANFIHGDLHSGNFLFRQDEQYPQGL